MSNAPRVTQCKTPKTRDNRRGAARTDLVSLLGMLLLIPVFVGIHYLSHLMRFDGRLGPTELERFWFTAGPVVMMKLIVFWRFQVCRSWGRPVSFYDIVVLVQAATTAMAVILLADYLLLARPTLPRSVFLLDYATTICVLGGVRAGFRLLHETSWSALFSDSPEVRVLIVGQADDGELVLRALLQSGQARYRIVGFVLQDTNLLGGLIGGVPVVGAPDEINAIIQRCRADQVLVLRGGMSGRQMRQLVEDLDRQSVEVKVLPNYQQIIDGRMTVQPRPVSIDDLLPRDPVRLDLEGIRNWMDGRVLLVTGSAGSIGSEICRQLARFSPSKIVMVDRAETGQFFLEREMRELAPHVEIEVTIADVLDKSRMREIFREHRPAIVFHAAAYKHVPLMERHPGEAVENIVTATRRLADLAMEFEVESFVMISTDKAVSPTSVMGACKRAAELYVQSLVDESATRFVTVRFGNVLDSAGSVLQVFRQQIAAGGPVTVTHPDMERYFMTIPEAAQLVLQAGAIGQSGQILTLDMGERVPVVDLARNMIRLSGYRPGEDMEIQFIGLRPGEKMIETLLADGEECLPTSHPKITVAASRRYDLEEVWEQIGQLEQLIHEPSERILAKLRATIPEYQRGEEEGPIERRLAA